MLSENYTESAISDRIKNFFIEFDHGKYIKKIDELTGSNLQINFYDLFDYDNKKQSDFKIHQLFLEKTELAIKQTKRAVKEIYQERYGSELAEKLEVNILIDKSELEITVNQAIKNKYVNKLVSLKGRISGESPIKTRLVKGVWNCNDGHEFESLIVPIKCQNGKCSNRIIKQNSLKSEYEYYRNFYLKDYENVDHNADTLVCEAKGDLTESAKNGEVVNVVGYSSVEQNENNLFNIFHLLNLKKVNEVSYDTTDQEKQIFESWTKEPGYWNKLINSISPNVYNSKLLKTAFLLGYVGASRWSVNQRYWINVLAVGDPATAKSKIAEWGKNNLPYVEFVSSKSSSAKGLFAGQKEQIDGEKVLEVGPMVTCSGRGLVCIDEFVRSSEIFDIFYTPMETGVFNSATVGGHADLATETPVYATGNPKKSNVWDEEKSIMENLDVMERSLLSRFDMIIITKDNANAKERRSIAESILESDEEIKKNQDIFDEVILTKILLYAKSFRPILTEQARKVIIDTYQDIHEKKELDPDKNPETNVRFVGMMARITLAVARCHLHNETTEEDVSLTHSIITEMLQQRGLKTSNVNTYVDRIAQHIRTVLAESMTDLTDFEIHTKLFDRFPDKVDTLRNDIGSEGPSRSKNKRWRAILDNVERSVMVEVTQKKNPRKLRWLHEEQKMLD